MPDPKRTKRKLISFSNYSICVTLPKKSLEHLGWHKGTEVDIAVNLTDQSMTLSRNAAPPTAAPEPLAASEPAIKPYHAMTEDHQPISESLRW